METMIATKSVDFASKFIMEKLERMLKEKAALLAGVEDDVRYIVEELRSITSFLKDMSTKQNLDDRQQKWVREVKELAYDAEDLIDEFNCRLRTPYDEHGVEGFFKHFLRSIKTLKARHGIASELKKWKVQVKAIKERNKRYSHPNEVLTSSVTATSSDMTDSYFDPRIIGHFVEEAQLVGINQSRDTLIEWVMDENRLEPTVISLVGFGGLGKTTLAKTVYDAPAIVGGHFQCRAWITVSQNYNIRELLKKIIRKISVTEQQIRDGFGCQDGSLSTEQILNMMEVLQLVETVRGHLDGKRYLFVFDDVWRAEAWKSLSLALPPGKEGSRVIVTTRIEEVANTSCSPNHRFIFKVSPLSPELSWELFCRRVFEAPDYSCPTKELENIGREILQKCNGLPLAIVTIGGLLASKPDKNPEDWKDLRDHLRLEIQTNDMLSKINQILLLSYNDLPYYLKPCFLFLGIFPEDYEIHRKHLMRLWIAEGIVSGVDELPAEKAAERCFNQLVSRSLVQPSEFYEFGKVKSCRIHDMTLELIVSISKEENFVVLLNEQPTIRSQHQKIRRLSWHGGSSGLVPDTELCHLRSFTAFCEDVPPKAYTKQRLLRTVDLDGCWKLRSVGHKTFHKLFLLKYLSLRNTGLSALPKSIGDLQNLECLDIRGTRIRKLPSVIVKLHNLVHLLASYYGKMPFPVTLHKDGFEVPKGISKLKELRTFGTVYADNVQLLREIGELVKLEKLDINFCYDRAQTRTEEISVLLSKLNGSLRHLKIQGMESNMKNALNEVASPPLRLYKLQIHAALGRLPAWFASLTQVVKITLFGTQLQLQDVQVLRNLNTLVKLVLGFASFVNHDEDLVFDQGGFAHLKILLIDTHNVSFEEGAVKSLEILKLYRLLVNGVEHLHGLKEVHTVADDVGMIEVVENIAANHSNRPKCFISP